MLTGSSPRPGRVTAPRPSGTPTRPGWQALPPDAGDCLSGSRHRPLPRVRRPWQKLVTSVPTPRDGAPSKCAQALDGPAAAAVISRQVFKETFLTRWFHDVRQT